MLHPQLYISFPCTISDCERKQDIRQTQMAGGYSEEKNAGIYWLIFCVVGMVTSLTLYGIALEFVTIGGKKLHETSFIFVTTSIYTVTGRSVLCILSFIHSFIHSLLSEHIVSA